MAEEYWFNSRAGIRRHYAEIREEDNAEYRRKVKRTNDDELAMLDALEQRALPKAES